MTKQSSELPIEGSAAKPKKMVGKMKVQGSFSYKIFYSHSGSMGNVFDNLLTSAVRKVKLALDPPSGCSFSLMKVPKVKIGSVRCHFSNLRSSISSGWKAVRKVRFAPRVSNGSFSDQSLAYVQAGTQYIKQVSGLLKVGVATLRSSSSSYEVQGAETPFFISE